MNESLRQAMLRARLREDDVAAHLGVDPKTVRRWLSGRVPYPSSRAALADLLGADEAELWPDAAGPLTGRSRPKGFAAAYPNRWTIPRETWIRFFQSAEHEIGVLGYSALFLAKDAKLLRIIQQKAQKGVRVRLILGNPDSLSTALCSAENAIDNTLAAKIEYALTLYRPLLKEQTVELRMHMLALYNSSYLSDRQILINQYTYGIPASNSPVFRYEETTNDQLFTTYVTSFEKIWSTASPYSFK